MPTIAPSPTLSDVIDQAPVTRFQIRVFVLCILVSLMDGFDTQSIAFVAPGIAKAWSVSQWHFGFIFSATLLGSAVGSAIFGILADRIGRRRLVIASTILFGVFSAACALSTDYWQLLAFRVAGGIGMGGVIPNMLALTAEYAPARRRTRIVTYTLWGFPFGAVVGGLCAGPLIGALGWRSVFWLGAAGPLLLAGVMLFALPESLRYLGLDSRRRQEMIALLRRIDPARADTVDTAPATSPLMRQKGHVRALFAPGLAVPTIVLSCVMFLSLLLTFMLINWMPTLLAQAGMSISKAILGTVALNLGGIIGSSTMSKAIDRRSHNGGGNNGGGRAPLLLAGSYACGAVMIVIASVGTDRPLLALLVLLACGAFHIGAQLSTTAYASEVFPVHLRGTGIGVMQAVGRAGSLIGPVVGGALLAGGVSGQWLLRMAVVPALLCGLLLLVLASGPRRPAPRLAAGRN